MRSSGELRADGMVSKQRATDMGAAGRMEKRESRASWMGGPTEILVNERQYLEKARGTLVAGG